MKTLALFMLLLILSIIIITNDEYDYHASYIVNQYNVYYEYNIIQGDTIAVDTIYKRIR
jgi:hypothetical protein